VVGFEKKMKRDIVIKMIFGLSLMPVSFVSAGEFHTIIGPDGRPMVVQRPDKRPEKLVQPEAETTNFTHKLKTSRDDKSQRDVVIMSSKNVPSSSNGMEKKTAQDIINADNQPLIFAPKEIQPVTSIVKPVEKLPDHSSSIKQPKQVVTPQKNIIIPETQATHQKEQKTNITTLTAQQQALTVIDGEQYIKSEYLEDKEFNIDGKKRFYTMPEGIIDTRNGSTRLQVIEREKGVGKSTLDHLFKKSPIQANQVIVLAPTYYRISQAEAVESLGQQCFKDKKIKKAKRMNAEQEINIWPRAPLKDQFDFEVVELSGQIQHVQINSYASQQNRPTFYWPLVIFLDAKGCVIEGAGGFKNHDTDASMIHFKKLEGVIRIPVHTQYLLMTPLLSAPDTPNYVLSNQGQLKLIALR